MRWPKIFFSTALLGVGLIALMESHILSGTTQVGNDELLDPLLRESNRAIAQAVRERFDNQPRVIEDILIRWKSKDHTYQSILNKNYTPKLLVHKGKRVRATDFKLAPGLVELANDFAAQSKEWDILPLEQELFVFWRGFFRGDVYVAVTPIREFLGGFTSQKSVVTWIVDAQGKVLFHPDERWLGVVASNLKVIAQLGDFLRSSREYEKIEKIFTMDQTDRWAALSTLPEQKMAILSEWHGPEPAPKSLPVERGSLALSFVALLGSIALLLSFGQSYRSAPSLESTESMDFVQSQLEMLKNERDTLKADWEKLSQGSYQEMIGLRTSLELLKVSDRLLYEEESRGDRLLQELKIHTKADVVVWYRFTQTSCSLVSESVLGAENADPVTQRFWRDTRIFLGTAEKLSSIESTTAFERWNEARIKILSEGDQAKLLFVPVTKTKSQRGAVALYFSDSTFHQEALKSCNELKEFAERITCLYELKHRLLEWRDAKTGASSGTLSASDHSRNQSFPA